MVLLIALTILMLGVAGTFAWMKGDLALFLVLLLGVALAVAVATPQVLVLQAQLQHALDTALPVARR